MRRKEIKWLRISFYPFCICASSFGIYQLANQLQIFLSSLSFSCASFWWFLHWMVLWICGLFMAIKLVNFMYFFNVKLKALKKKKKKWRWLPYLLTLMFEISFWFSVHLLLANVDDDVFLLISFSISLRRFSKHRTWNRVRTGEV